MERKITLQDSLDVVSREQTVTVDVTKLTPEIIAKLAMHGLTQKVADAAASAKKLADAEGETRTPEEIAVDLMTKVKTRLEAGEWGAERGTGGTTDPLDSYRIKVVRMAMAAKGNEAIKAQYDAIDSSDQAARRAFIMAIAHAKADAVDAKAKELKAIDDATKAAAKGITL